MNQLTKREFEVMNLVTSGYTDDEIAKKLHISINATKICISNIYRKLKAKNCKCQQNDKINI